MAAQVDKLYRQAHTPVDMVAESGMSPYGRSGAQAQGRQPGGPGRLARAAGDPLR